MENLDRLTATGLPIYDLNSEQLERKDWSQTPLGARDSWPVALTCLVNTCILPIPHCAAIFWGSSLSVVHNLAWGKARGQLDGQGTSAVDTYGEEALSSLRAALRGRTCKVAYKFFLEKKTPDHSQDAQILLSTILDEKGKRQGVLAQRLETAQAEKHMPLSGLDELAAKHPAHKTKDFESQGDSGLPHKKALDSQQTQLFSKFAELLPNGLAILDKDAEAVFVNDGFFKLTTNKGLNEFRAWPESIHPEDYERVMSAYRQAFRERDELRIEFRCTADAKGEDGEWRMFLFRPLSEDADAGFICAVVDITSIKKAQLTQEKAATEAQERKEQQERFIDMVSHEIRNPLSAVMHLAEEVKEVAQELGNTYTDAKDQVSDILDAADTILLCVSHQNTLVDDILSFSKLDSMMLSLVPREVRPKWDFSRALKVFHSEFKAKGIQFHYAMDYSFDELEVDYVVADLNRMKQVLVNLITNAIKFTARKNGERKITVSMGASLERPTSYPPNVIFFGQDKDSFHIDSTISADWGNGPPLYLMVAVKDTGIGISRDDQVKLFERFRQATPKTQENYGGSGLGLFISRKLCQLHGGDIGVASKKNEGSTFGWFFRVRKSNGTLEGGRPPFGTRSTSESSNPSRNEPPVRPSYSRANSNLQNIKERSNEQRPKPHTLTSHEGVDDNNEEDCLMNPPTELRPESRPQASADDRYAETEAISNNIKERKDPFAEAINSRGPDLQAGETNRQKWHAEAVSKRQKEAPSDAKYTLLFVEDNLINQKVLRRQLQSRGFEVFVANNGQEAIDAVVSRGSLPPDSVGPRNYFDCILMDQEMPVKDGNAATIEIRELQEQGKAGHSPILGVSANVREAQTKSMLDAGMDAVISKPFKVEDLVKKIRSLLPKSGNG
ncbi:two component histidine kinase 1 [Lentithecium fluviatile CBS 122367]|uniref:Two component histidine kinase 1 n=1 Tax=Lentithecium fluviatile CBS 122367 TaxID=1168545 RepID=A0A6G1IPK8_9PLEO|nr:two component histidine kinase 1 [Lentithecium fluviatile CBS 122367]